MNSGIESVRVRKSNADPLTRMPSGLRPRTESFEGRFCIVEPLDPDAHAGELYEASHEREGSDAIWTYLPYGPFPSREAFGNWLRSCASTADPLYYAIRSRATGHADGVATLMTIEPLQGSIEIGHIMFGLPLQKTPAATEALYLLFRHAMDDLGYRRLEWKCDAMNDPSRRAAVRLGFAYEGLFFRHRIVKGRNRDTAWYSILDDEWPSIRRCFETWLSPGNFDERGRQRSSLSALTGECRAIENF